MEPTIEMLVEALKRWHINIFPDTKHADFVRDTNVAKGKVAMIEQVLWWIDSMRSGIIGNTTRKAITAKEGSATITGERVEAITGAWSLVELQHLFDEMDKLRHGGVNG